ncbi:MAG: response regulator [Sphingomonas sp.]
MTMIAVLASAGLLWWLLRTPIVAAGFLAVFVGVLALLLIARLRAAPSAVAAADVGLLASVIAAAPDPLAVTDRSGRLVCANAAYEAAFPGIPLPSALALNGDGASRVAAAGKQAWRDGVGHADGLSADGRSWHAYVTRGGTAEDHLVWRLAQAAEDGAGAAHALVEGAFGRRLGEAGVMVALVDAEGRLLAANRVLLARAAPEGGMPSGQLFVDLLRRGSDDLLRLVADGADAVPLRLVQVELDGGGEARAPSLFLILDEEGNAGSVQRSTATANVHALLAMLPLGLALAERDGRLLFMNDAFRRAAGLEPGQAAVYPSDLVVREDKGAVADAIRRFASGRLYSGDLSVRLLARGDEPVSLTVAGATGLGDATVLLSLKDNSEESRLKRQVAQASKMQAVGQLAGGVAHDFNNILTAIIGHCDLMLMRHSPGDSDYDDIQQIKHNSNRAAGLTRQLLAFSRQQTLRPQVLQLPDVISEISNLLKRLLGETVVLVVKHGRNLGAVRADPGQLEQVIVNLAVNARDAMAEKGGGTLTIQTYSVSADQVRDLGSEILPVGDYTALSVDDTGTGIPDDVLPKIFEPFFTTKEVGKGTGLGLSTVYGIVKQSGGYIFADSKAGQGTSFVIYLPVFFTEARAEPALPRPKPKPAELWGTGTIVVVEDEDMVRAVAERALARQGYRVHTAANGEAALELLERLRTEGEAVDLMVSDVVMPGMDGPTTVRRAREAHPMLPVLFMSGYAEEQLRRSIDLDRVAFLPKPFSVQQLAEAARDAMAAGKDR